MRQEENQGMRSSCGAGMEVVGRIDKSSFCQRMEPKKGTQRGLWLDKSKAHSYTATMLQTSGLGTPYTLKCIEDPNEPWII